MIITEVDALFSLARPLADPHMPTAVSDDAGRLLAYRWPDGNLAPLPAKDAIKAEQARLQASEDATAYRVARAADINAAMPLDQQIEALREQLLSFLPAASHTAEFRRLQAAVEAARAANPKPGA